MVHSSAAESQRAPDAVTLVLTGDVMTGRGIDQVLPHPSDPALHETGVRDARRYVELAERQSGAIPRPVKPEYLWGDALNVLDAVSADIMLVNLETAVTTSDDHWRGKGVHYRMHPRNTPCLTAAGIDCCSVANNHVLDWGYPGLSDTIRSLADAGIETTGAGGSREQALRPAHFDLGDRGRVLVFGVGSPSSGIPSSWAAGSDRAGVLMIDEAEPAAASQLHRIVDRFRRPGDVVVVSVHWGPNWGNRIPRAQTAFAHRLVDDAGVDIVHGHSSHHVKGLEVYRDRPIFYGCGDLVTDYEGIGGYEQYRPELGLLYVVTLEATTGALLRLEMHPMRMEQFQLRSASSADAAWLAEHLAQAGPSQEVPVERNDGTVLTVRLD